MARKRIPLKLRKVYPENKPPETVWLGPEQDGVTSTLLSRFLHCRERFRIMVVEGLKPVPEFTQRIEYGNMWHVCEEALAAQTDWRDALAVYCKKISRLYPTQGQQINHWFNVCKTQFPIYVDYWAEHPDEKHREPIVQEEPFEFYHSLPSGRTVKLRGIFDSVDLIGKGKNQELSLQENKTKGDVDEILLNRRLMFDQQTMIYMTALNEIGSRWTDRPLRSVRYNVIRRPLSGGKYTIKPHIATQKKPAESMPDFYNRLGGCITGDPEFFFIRRKVHVTQGDIEHFRTTFLDPVLEQLWDWWEWIEADPKNPWRNGNRVHFRYPYGVYNPTLEGRESEMDEYIDSGSKLGLMKVDTLFPEFSKA